MDEEEWIYKQVIESNKKRFIGTFQTEIDYFRNGIRITILPLDVLALVLSFVDFKDVKNCMCVCKLFYEATKKDHFWNRLIKKRLEYALVESRFISVIGNFYFPEYFKETMRLRYEWLFKKKYLNCSLTYKEIYQIERYIDFGSGFGSGRTIRLKINVKTLQMLWLEFHDLFYNQFRDLKFYDSVNKRIINLPLKNEYVFTKGKIDKIIGTIAKYNAQWSGSCINIGGVYVPNGNGRWIFKDGTILEGDNVAKNGEPVFIISYEDWVRLQQCNLDQKLTELSECKTCL